MADCGELSWKTLKKMAKMYCLINPALSRYYLSRASKMKAKIRNHMSGNAVIPKKSSHCSHCFTVFKPGNHHIRLRPRKSLTKTCFKLLARSTENPKQLGTFQKAMVELYLHSKNKLVISCFTCNKTVKVPCQSHEERVEQLVKTTKETEEKVMTKKQRKKEKKKKMKEKKKKKFRKYLFDNEVEALSAAIKKNNISEDNSEQTSVLGEQIQILKTSDIQTRKATESLVQKKQIQPSSVKAFHNIHNASRTGVKSQNVGSKKTSRVVKPDLISKKKKSRDIHQQLQKVLAADKRKKSRSSLQDFLTCL